MQPHLKRRTLLGLMTAVGAGVGLGTGSLAMPAQPPAPLQRILGLFSRPESARAVGRAYLRQCPTERNPEKLLSLICERDAAWLRAVPEAELRTFLHTRHREDFQNQRTVVVSGWVLSRTEARMYALSALA